VKPPREKRAKVQRISFQFLHQARLALKLAQDIHPHRSDGPFAFAQHGSTLAKNNQVDLLIDPPPTASTQRQERQPSGQTLLPDEMPTDALEYGRHQGVQLGDDQLIEHHLATTPLQHRAIGVHKANQKRKKRSRKKQMPRRLLCGLLWLTGTSRSTGCRPCNVVK
jgi:hypothetical protein